MFSFLFVLIVVNFFSKFNNTYLINFILSIFICILYNFICFFFCFSFHFVILYYEFLISNLNILLFDFISFSNYLFSISSKYNTFSICFCSYIFSLFYFILVFSVSFIFFIIRCLFTIVFDFLFFNFDIHYAITIVNVLHYNFNELFIIPFNSICFELVSLFSFLFLINLIFIICYLLLHIFYSWSFISLGLVNLLISNLFWHFISFNKVFSRVQETSLTFFKYLFNDVFFLFTFVVLIFIVSFFGFIVKDFLFINIFFDLLCIVSSFDTINYNSFIWNKNNLNILNLATLYF